MKLADIGLFLRSARSDARLPGLWVGSDPKAVFDDLCSQAPENDPWASAGSRFLYQRRKYDVVASLIPQQRYRRAIDLGCGAGLFSQRLAKLADDVVGVDVSSVAVEHEWSWGGIIRIGSRVDAGLLSQTTNTPLYFNNGNGPATGSTGSSVSRGLGWTVFTELGWRVDDGIAILGQIGAGCTEVSWRQVQNYDAAKANTINGVSANLCRPELGLIIATGSALSFTLNYANGGGEKNRLTEHELQAGVEFKFPTQLLLRLIGGL
jgi:SAM-dependent methyltransferase